MGINENSVGYYDMAIKANLLHGVHALQNSEPVLAKLVEQGKVRIIGALFNLETGRITIMEK